MESVTIGDKTFVPMIPEKEIQDRIRSLAKEIDECYGSAPIVGLIILKGAFIFAADLLRAVSSPVNAEFMRISSYREGMKSGELSFLEEELNVEGQEVLIIEDIVDSGKTLEFLRSHLQKMNPVSVRVACLLYKPEAFQGRTAPEFIGFSIPPEFVVGYGMDYAERGRALKSIYQYDPQK